MGALPIKLTGAIMCLLSAWSWIGVVSSSPSTCNPLPAPNTFRHDLHHRCPVSISSPLPIEKMDGSSIELVLSSRAMNVSTAVLFYDSGSPFSTGFRSKFDMLSSIFPQISHIVVERSLTMPSLFSRYGIHSLPALFIVNQTTEMRYYGPKDLHSLTQFYSGTTGSAIIVMRSFNSLLLATNLRKSLKHLIAVVAFGFRSLWGNGFLPEHSYDRIIRGQVIIFKFGSLDEVKSFLRIR